MKLDDPTFANLPRCIELDAFLADVAILGVPHGTPYPDEPSGAVDSPTVIRRQSIQKWFGLDVWDFDLDGTLLGDSSARVVDCGDLPVEALNPKENNKITCKAMKAVLQAGGVPIVLGGDDSIAIMVVRGYEGFGPINVLQIDAHIDWRDKIKNETEGYSSTMRRISEMPWVDKIIQVGMRGKGSARREEFEAGKSRGVRFITANTVHKDGVGSVLELIPEGSAWFISLDVDSLDPSIMPAVNYPAPGGFSYLQLNELLGGLAKKAKIVGLNMVELAPAQDVNNLSAITAANIIWNVIGMVVRSPYFKKASPTK